MLLVVPHKIYIFYPCEEHVTPHVKITLKRKEDDFIEIMTTYYSKIPELKVVIKQKY